MNLSEAKDVDGDGGAGTVVKHSYLMAGVPFPAPRSGNSPNRVLVERLQDRAREQTLENLRLMAESGTA